MSQEGISPVMPKRVAIYTRYSSDMQRPASLDDQERNCREVAEKKGWLVVDEFVRGDAAKTGKVLKHRKGLEFLMAQAELNPPPFDVLITDEMSRLSRKLKDILGIAEMLRFCGVKLYIVSHELDSDQESFSMMVNLLGAIAEEQSKDMRRRVLRGQEGRVRKGFKSGGRCFGYRSIAITNTAQPELQGRAAIEGYKEVVYEPEAARVRRIFRLYSDGLTISDIVTMLNGEGVPAARPARIAPSRTWWSASLVKRILKNEKYIGKRAWNKTHQLIDPRTDKTVTRKNGSNLWVPSDDANLRIVSDELWMRAQERLDVVNAKMTRHRIAALSRAKRRDYLFNGLLDCGICGSPIVISGNGYVCASWRHKRGCTNGLWIKEERLTSQLIAAFAKNLLVPEVIDYFVDAVSRDFERYMKGMPNNDENSREGLQKLESTLRQSCQRIGEAMMNPVSANSTFLPLKLAELEAELAKVQTQIRVWDSPKTLETAKFDIAGMVKENISNMLEIVKQDAPKAREVLQRRIKKLQLFPVMSPDGPAFEIYGEIDLFTSPTGRNKSVLVVCSSTGTDHQHTTEVDFVFRFIGVVLYPDVDVEGNPLIKPLSELLAVHPELLHEPKSSADWAALLKPYVPLHSELHDRITKRYVTLHFREHEGQFVDHFEMTLIDYRRKTWFMFSKVGPTGPLAGTCIIAPAVRATREPVADAA